mmetsp:Transcript_2320/g.1663  ORF Transcript_2320/g.1663 Transcript_2320/m.1663 type:complete len:269 (+) Transcript_2320:113-919(+)
MPKKSKHRMRAHINPMGELVVAYPLNPSFAQWHLHYPSFFNIKNNHGDVVYCNTTKHPIDYNKAPVSEVKLSPKILDIGCGYGNFLVPLSNEFKDKLILGMEIRDKVVNYAAEKINTIRINSGYKCYMNIAVVRTNAMKTIHNYFPKNSVEKMFFCFADPHFKKQNHRRRIISTGLLSDYLYTMKEGGKIYVVTDVKDLFDWEVGHMEAHPMLEKVDEAENAGDPCVKFMREQTDEAKKVIRNEGQIWHAVFMKRAAPSMIKVFNFFK